MTCFLLFFLLHQVLLPSMPTHEDKFVKAIRDILCGPKTDGMGYFDQEPNADAFRELWGTLEPHLRTWYREHTIHGQRYDLKGRARRRYEPTEDGEPKFHSVSSLVSLACMQRAVTAC